MIDGSTAPNEVGLDQIEKEGEPRPGDQIDRLTRHYADQMNTSELATLLRERRLAPDRYKTYISRVYPLATDFNRGLIRSLTKIEAPEAQQPEIQALIKELQTIDQVIESNRVIATARNLLRLVMKAIQDDKGEAFKREDYFQSDLFLLAAQLYEEQQHNNYFRDMLDAHQIDHQAANNQFQQYMESHHHELEERATIAIKQLKDGQLPGQHENCPFPETVIALAHLLRKYSTDPSTKFIIYNAIQSAIELTLFKVISESIYPGVAGPEGQANPNLELVPDYDPEKHGNLDTPQRIPASIRWWDEHANYGQGGNIEGRHIQESLERLNNELSDPADAQEALEKINDVLLLFSATMSLS